MKIRFRTLQLFFALLPVILFLTFVVGFRAKEVGSDTCNYLFFYHELSHNYLLLWPLEYCFKGILYLFSIFSAPFQLYLSAIALINIILIIFLVRKLSNLLEGKIDGYRLFFLVATFLFISPFFFAGMVNVIRQGTAILALFIFYITLTTRARLWSLIPVAVLAFGFHKVTLMMIIFSPLVVLPYRIILGTVLTASICYFSGSSIKLIYLLSTISGFDLYSKIVNYAATSSPGTHYLTGVRYDFALFTITMGVMFHILNKYFLAIDDRAVFRELLKIYWVLILPFFLLGFGPYSDRYLLTGWLYLSIAGAVLLGLIVRKYPIRIGWDCLIFLCSLLYFSVKVQVL
ncbi:EpsG family protein [Legionella clemsonensis]|uniref:Transmembrane protein EpsG n=1 Tax=Legionella clemsonensis TaxID=1867846 RepID=A0A222P3J6_9GAMM|nr:EpsG family protein [Legionella clemsonensis]ASQ46401.1 hypothetical protein clem_09255 [Legionella clemsonensis]